MFERFILSFLPVAISALLLSVIDGIYFSLVGKFLDE